MRKILFELEIQDAMKYTLHSGRRGGATQAFQDGCSFIVVKRQGRWSSDSSPQIYIDSDLSSQLEFTSHLKINS